MRVYPTLTIKVRWTRPGTPGSRMRVMTGLQGRVLFYGRGVVDVEIDREKARAALAKNDAYVRKRWEGKPEPWRKEWERQVARWEKILA